MSNRNPIPQAAPATRNAEIQKQVRHVKRTFATADPRQVARLAKARTTVAALENEPLLRDDAMEVGELGIAKKNVRLAPNTLGIMGQSGRGKSTTKAALIRRSDIHPNASGKPLTAGITRTFMDIDPDSGEAEYAVLQMRKASEIQALAERQVKAFGIDDFHMPHDIEDLPTAIDALGIEATTNLESLLKVIEQFIRHEDLITGSIEHRRIRLDSPTGRQRLHDILREDSPENRNPENRIVDIVKSVDIHLYRPAREDDTHLQLPDTCLVDTPGTGGTTLHAWGLQELISDGNLDVILFCINPRRVTETEFQLARSLNAAIRSGHLQPQQLLLIHNAIDEEIQHEESETAISELRHVLGGGSETFHVHETSALAALWALEARNGTPVPNPEKYKSMAVALGLDPEEVRDLDNPELHTAVYNNSGLPKLIQAINAVTRTYTVEARVTAAEAAVGKTVTRLAHHYAAEQQRLAEQLNKHGNPDFKSVEVLAEKEAEAQAYIGSKRSALLETENETLQKLYNDASEKLYTRLAEALPTLWDDSLVPDRLRTAPTSPLRRPLPRTFVSDTEEWVWLELDLKPIGHYFAERIETEFGDEACQALLTLAFNTDITEDVMNVEAVREITRDIGRDIIDFAAKAGKAMLGKPEYRLIPFNRSTDNRPAVVELLETIANTHDRTPDAEHLQALLNAIRTCYEPGIQEAVAAIRGFHEAKLADIERDFRKLIFKTFITLQDQRNSDQLVATLFEAVDEDIQTLHLQKQTVDEKLARLKTIETLLRTTDSPETSQTPDANTAAV